jgi:hemolysin III
MTTAFAPSSVALTTSFAATTTVDARSSIHGPRPLLRGRLHQLCAFASVPAGAHLVASATPGDRAAAVAHALTWSAMFATSASYHRLAQSPTARRRMRQADHSMIFVHMGGAATAMALLCLTPLLALLALVPLWAAVAAGIGLKLTRLADGSSAGSWLYGVIGGTQVLALPLVASALTPGQLALLVLTGALYGAGAVLFFQKRPDPLPTIFGYHEVWHCFTLAAGLCQYVLVLQLTAG